MAFSLVPALVHKVGLQLLLEPQSSAPVLRVACSAAGLLWPAYQTCKSIEQSQSRLQHTSSSTPAAAKQSTSQTSKACQISSHEQWLTFWVAHAALTLAESLVGDPLLMQIPFYFHVKFGFLIWLQLPSAQGAKKLYDKARPNFLKYGPKLEVCVDRCAEAMAMLYAMYRVPIEQTLLFGAYAISQGKVFFEWFLHGEDSSAPPISSSGVDKLL